MLSSPYYAENYAGIIDTSLVSWSRQIDEWYQSTPVTIASYIATHYNIAIDR